MTVCPHGMVLNSNANPKYGAPWCAHCLAWLEKAPDGTWRAKDAEK